MGSGVHIPYSVIDHSQCYMNDTLLWPNPTNDFIQEIIKAKEIQRHTNTIEDQPS